MVPKNHKKYEFKFPHKILQEAFVRNVSVPIDDDFLEQLYTGLHEILASPLSCEQAAGNKLKPYLKTFTAKHRTYTIFFDVDPAKKIVWLLGLI